jgi:hypothetical protein
VHEAQSALTLVAAGGHLHHGAGAAAHDALKEDKKNMSLKPFIFFAFCHILFRQAEYLLLVFSPTLSQATRCGYTF